MRIYVGNLPFRATEDELRETFSEFGNVTSASIITDRETGRSRGFGFVEFSDDADGENAIKEMNGKDMQGRPLVVNEARERQPRSGGGGGGGYGGGGGRGRRRGGGAGRCW